MPIPSKEALRKVLELCNNPDSTSYFYEAFVDCVRKEGKERVYQSAIWDLQQLVEQSKIIVHGDEWDGLRASQRPIVAKKSLDLQELISNQPNQEIIFEFAISPESQFQCSKRTTQTTMDLFVLWLKKQHLKSVGKDATIMQSTWNQHGELVSIPIDAKKLNEMILDKKTGFAAFVNENAKQSVPVIVQKLEYQPITSQPSHT